MLTSANTSLTRDLCTMLATTHITGWRQQPRRACKKRKKEYRAIVSHNHYFCQHRALPILPAEILTTIFLYIDVKEVLAVSVACREWKAALLVVESELWLLLIRKHHPTVEKVTKLLRCAHEESSVAGNEDIQTSLSLVASPLLHLPPPSFNWKTQFQRRHLFAIRLELPYWSIMAAPMSPRPLSSYIALVDFTCREGTKKTGRVSTCVTDLRFNAENARLELELEDLAPKLSRFNYDIFDITIHLIECSSGKQTLIYHGKPEEQLEDESFCYDIFTDFDVSPILMLHSPDIASYVHLEKTGCICHCDNSSFFQRLHQDCDCVECVQQSICGCCSCKTKWSCFQKYRIELCMIRDLDFDFDEQTNEELLRFLQDGLIFS